MTTQNFVSMPSAEASDPYRLKLHLMPPQGWLNDPNGLCQFRGLYHFFFQYTPDDPNGGQKYWGHYESSDLINWRYTGAPLAPDTPWDQDGVYSGCALVDHDEIKLYYTGNVKEEGEHDYVLSGRSANTLLVTTKDGIHMSGKRLLMTNADYPSDLSCHVRDPKVWKDGPHYYMVQGARTKDDIGVILLFESMDGENWFYRNRLQTDAAFGYMWECPDFFTLGCHSFLSLSPQGVPSEMLRYQNIYQSGYFKVYGNLLTPACNLSDFQEWDYGFDFYAPQTFMDEQGRRILVGWMGIPDADYTNPTVEAGWQHALTLPRELTVDDSGSIHQNPIAELNLLRQPEISFEGPFYYNSVHALDVVFTALPDADIHIQVGSGLLLSYQKEDGIFSMEFTDDSGCGRTCRRAQLGKLQDMRLIIDTSAIEVYCNQGSAVFTSRYYTAQSVQSIAIETAGCIGKLYPLQSLEVSY